MKMYHVVADGFERFRIREYCSVLPEISGEEKEFLDSFVQEQRAKARERDGSFYDGDIVGLLMQSLQTDGSEISAATQRIKYSYHAGLYRVDPNAALQALYVNGIMITRDNRLVLGTTQATEADWMGKLSLPAGAVDVGPDGYPSLGAQVLREFAEECGLSIDHHVAERKIFPGWINGMSAREGNYHLTVSFICPLIFNEMEMSEYFRDWKALQEKSGGGKVEFENLRFLPNDPRYISEFVKEQDTSGNARTLGKSLDVMEEWASRYGCDMEELKGSKGETRLYLPQPRIPE
jgi:ADP-ribose pyrophosphatase YjhB (NUDIX family)